MGIKQPPPVLPRPALEEAGAPWFIFNGGVNKRILLDTTITTYLRDTTLGTSLRIESEYLSASPRNAPPL